MSRPMPMALLLLALVAPSVALADDTAAKRAAAERYVASVPVTDMTESLIQGTKAMLPPQQQPAFEKMLREILTPEYQRYISVEAMVSTMELDEIEAVADFYSSPVGQRILGKMPRLMALTMEMTQCKVLGTVRTFIFEQIDRELSAERRAQARGEVDQQFRAQFPNCPLI